MIRRFDKQNFQDMKYRPNTYFYYKFSNLLIINIVFKLLNIREAKLLKLVVLYNLCLIKYSKYYDFHIN